MLEPIMKMAGYVPANTKPDIAKRSSKWPDVSHKHLDSNPTCAACGTLVWDIVKKKLLVDASVHHCKPYHNFPELELDPGNLLTLCEQPSHNDHFWLGHLGDWVAHNPTVREDAAYFLAKIKSRPY